MLIGLVDFGLVILIWMTQLVVYPSFTYFSPENLYTWHKKYTTAISVIVMPLMLSQIALHLFQLYEGFNWLRLIALLLIVLAWINTFFYAVPLHNKIEKNNDIINAASSLVAVNWYRTSFWSASFAVSLLDYLKSS